MVFQNEKRGVPIRFLTGLFAGVLFLAGCAGTSSTATRQEDPASNGSDPDGHIVVGQGTAEDQAVINASNQKIFDAEHAESPDATAAPPSSSQP
jgi:hypothetical protein